MGHFAGLNYTNIGRDHNQNADQMSKMSLLDAPDGMNIEIKTGTLTMGVGCLLLPG